jgi:hypothetical protein
MNALHAPASTSHTRRHAERFGVNDALFGAKHLLEEDHAPAGT